ncbi:MAG TPA: VPLPA-CTERM sorting domain-containing protein [Alphaproteobacteria bacterium]|nr:VPLPA-CTERM sorting domain-containing protein [Alphaproteobacteria bacterium]
MDKYLFSKATGVMNLRFSSFLLAAGFALGIMGVSADGNPASASLCGTTVNTTWSAPSDTNTTLNQTSFQACSTVSTLAGDGVLTIDPDPYVISVGAVDDDTFQLMGTISDALPTGVGDSPDITLVLSDISWLGMSGVISNVIYTPGENPGGNFFALDSFTDDSITLSGSWYCMGENCPAFDLLLGTIDVVAEHTAVPLPAALPLFLSGLVAVGAIGRRRRPRATGAAA